MTIKEAGNVAHLHSIFEGRLKAGLGDEELIQALHPTPAMGGFPQKNAYDWIVREEVFDRGSYSAPIGWVSPKASHLVVGIRSLFIDGKKMHLFSGAGIVGSSFAEKEWEELENKIKPFTPSEVVS